MCNILQICEVCYYLVAEKIDLHQILNQELLKRTENFPHKLPNHFLHEFPPEKKLLLNSLFLLSCASRTKEKQFRLCKRKLCFKTSLEVVWKKTSKTCKILFKIIKFVLSCDLQKLKTVIIILLWIISTFRSLLQFTFL